MTPLCPYCSMPAQCVSGQVIYPGWPELAGQRYWRCVPCRAHVGCHGKSNRPLGRLSNPTLRRLKVQAHAAFDPIWKSKGKTRYEAYRWLAEQLDLPADKTHIGMFDEAQCQAVIRLCLQYKLGAQHVRADS